MDDELGVRFKNGTTIVFFILIITQCRLWFCSDETGSTDEADDYIISGNMPKGCILYTPTINTYSLEQIQVALCMTLERNQIGHVKADPTMHCFDKVQSLNDDI